MTTASQAAPAVKKNKGGRPRKSPPIPERVNRVVDEEFHDEPVKTKTEGRHPYWCGPVPVSGKCYRVRIIANGNELRFPKRVPLQLGEMPKIQVLANVEAILPEEYISILKDTTVDVPVGANYSEGEALRYEQLVRIPYSIMGPATWDEYQAWRDQDKKKPIIIEQANPYTNF